LAKGVGASRFTGKPHQQRLTEASTGVGHTSASTDDADQFGANGSCSVHGFHWETGRRMCDTFSVRRKKLEPERACILLCVNLWWKVKALYPGWWTLCFSVPNWTFLELWLNQKGLALVVRALAVKGQSILLRT